MTDGLKLESSSNRFSKWLRRGVALGLVASTMLMLVSLIRVHLLPTIYVILIVVIYGVLTLLLAWFLSVRKKTHLTKGLILVLLISLLLTVINVGATYILRKLDSTLGSMRPGAVSYVEYSVIAKKDRDIQLKSATKAGVVKTDLLLSKQIIELKKLTDADMVEYDNLAELMLAIDSDAMQIGSLRTSSLQLVEMNQPELYENIIVLATFKVKDDKGNTQKSGVAGKPFIVYISGNDAYGTLSSSSRSDVNILIVVNPAKHSMLLVNTPRDYYVQLHGTTGNKDKLTHAGVYGVDVSRQTLEDLYGQSIPYHVRINFTSFLKLIDVVGPINVVSDYAFKSYHKGVNTLNSQQALEFARERYSLSGGDRQRGKNQQRIIEAIMAKISRPQNAVKIPQILDAIRDSIETNMSDEFVRASVRWQLNNLGNWQVSSIAVDGSGAMLVTHTYGSQPLYVMIPNEESLAQAKQAIAEQLVE